MALGGNVASGSSPSNVAANLTTGYQAIYYVNSNGGISYWDYIPGTGWASGTQGGSSTAYVTPSVVDNPSSGYQAIYYTNGGGGISYWSWASETGWNSGTL